METERQTKKINVLTDGFTVYRNHIDLKSNSVAAVDMPQLGQTLKHWLTVKRMASHLFIFSLSLMEAFTFFTESSNTTV